MVSAAVSRALERGDAARKAEDRIGQAYLGRLERRRNLTKLFFLLLVAGPTLLSAFYFGLAATPRFESEAQFIVRSAASGHSVGGLLNLVRAFGIGRSDDDTNSVVTYLKSRDAVAGVEATLPLEQLFGRDLADPLSRYPRPWGGSAFEYLYNYMQDRISVIADADTGIVTLRVQAFRAQDAQSIARQLIAQAENMVNKLNARLESDTVRSASQAVAEATALVLKSQEDLTRFRNSAMVVDPSKNALAQIEKITSLSMDLDKVLASLDETNHLTSRANPEVNVLKARVAALEAQIASEQKGLAGDKDGIADKVSAYERLGLVRGLADNSLSAATISLETARSDARRQRIYVEEITAANLPDIPTQPERLRAVATVLALSLTAYAMYWIVAIGVREHRA